MIATVWRLLGTNIRTTTSPRRCSVGVAAYRRGSQLIRRQIDQDQRPVEFDIMDRLNGLPRRENAATPFGPIEFSASHGGWWAVCPVTGFGYWYETLHRAVSSWNVDITGYRDGDWLAVPRKSAQAC